MFLKINDKGNDVVTLQNRLKSLGFNSGTPDGIFGPITFNAVKKFQAVNKLPQDGIVTDAVWRKLFPSAYTGSVPKIVSPKLNLNFLKNKNVIIAGACMLVLAMAMFKKRSEA